MKVIITTILFLTLISLPFKSIEVNSTPSTNTLFKQKMDILFKAIAYVESRNNPKAWNKKENAVGCVQIRLIAVKEVNRIYRLNIKHLDCFDVNVSYRVFMLTMRAYNKEGDFERGSRVWNAGCLGWYVTETNDYWIKVEEQLKKNKHIIK